MNFANQRGQLLAAKLLRAADEVHTAKTTTQRHPSVVVTRWVHARWHEAVIDSPDSVEATTTAIEGAAVILGGMPPVVVKPVGGGLIWIDFGSAKRPEGVGANNF